jgi:hypothetical protein
MPIRIEIENAYVALAELRRIERQARRTTAALEALAAAKVAAAEAPHFESRARPTLEITLPAPDEKLLRIAVRLSF